MIPIFAWRNMWRNKLRSFILILAVTIGIFSGIFLIAFSNGMVNSRIGAVINNEMSHIQIHAPNFLDNYQFSLRFTADSNTLSKLSKVPNIKAFSKRIIINSMIASAETGVGVKITGVDSGLESKVTSIASKLTQGQYFDDKIRNPVVISQRLADKLKVKLRNKIIITVQDESNDIISGAFRVTGIFETENFMFDDANIFLNINDLASLLGISPNEVHEFAILIDKNKNTDAVTSYLSAIFPELEVKNWMQLSPEAGMLVDVMNQYNYIFTIIILLALCFGIINTMLMVIMERRHELGMLMAIGMNRRKVFVMIMFETIFLSISGGIIGLLLGWLLSNYLQKTGIDLYFWKEAFGEMGYSSMVYPVVETNILVSTTIMIIITGVLASIYPAFMAIKLNPTQAIRSI